MSRLQVLCQVFGWQGGTIHQAKAELARYRFTCDVLAISEESFKVMIDILRLRMVDAKMKMK